MYCRYCGKELAEDSKFCPYCGKEVKTKDGTEEAPASAVVPEKQKAEQTPSVKKTAKTGAKKIALVAGIVLGLVVLGVGISALANNVKENKKNKQEMPQATATPKPNKTPTPTPTRKPTIDDVILFVSEEQVELGTERKVIRVQLVENGYESNKYLVYEIEDTSVVSCEWGEWGTNLTIPLRIYPKGIGETTITIKLADSNICKEIKVFSNGEDTSANMSEEAEPEVTSAPKPTATPTPTEKQEVTNTPTPVPAKTATADDMELRLSATRIEIGDTPQTVKVEIIENGYTDWDSLDCEVADKSIVSYKWGDWEDTEGYVCPLTITAKSVGETTITVYILDAEEKPIISKEIKVISNHEASLENVKLEVSPESVHVGEKPQTVLVKINRNGYRGSMSLMFFIEDESVAGAMWDKNTDENDLIIYGKKKGTTSVFIGVSGGKGVVEVKVTSEGATVLTTPTPKPTATPKPVATATPTPKTATFSKSGYMAMDSSGMHEMSVKPGFAATVTKETKYAKAAEQAKMLLPDLEAWSEGKFIRSEVAEHDTYTALYYHAPTMSKEDSLAMLEEYYKLLEGYGVYKNITQTSSLYSYYYEWQDMDYTGNVSITENAATSYDELPCDLSGWYSYEGFGDIVYGIEYPEEIGLTDTGERYGGKTVKITKTEILENTSMPEYTVTESGLDCFKITGWGWEETDYVEICLHPELYEKGDVFNLKDFAAQADAGSGKLNSFTVRSMRIGREDWLYKNVISPNKEHKHMFDSIRVEIVEKSETVTVIQYVAKIRNVYGDDYVLEGLFAVKTGEEVSAGSSSSERESVSIGIGEVRCTSCKGTGVRENNCIRCRSKGEIACSYCSGDGEVDCTKCGGDGRIWDALNGEDARCSSCYGSGDKRCTKCSGTGDVNCTSCGGKGYTESQCSICLGRGKY